MDQKPGPDFWLVTKDRASSIFNQDIESRALVMQMQPTPLMPGMPTPSRPPRTQSTMKSLSIYAPLNSQKSTNNESPPNSSFTTTTAPMASLGPSWAIPKPLRLNKPLNLNKPLPIPRLSLDIEEAIVWEGESERISPRKVSPKNMMSVYKLVPYEDGHMSVHKTKQEVENLI